MGVVQAVRSRVAPVVVAHPAQVRLIAEARVKTDKIDAAVLAQLYASGFLPEEWISDDATQTLRGLHTYLLPRCPAADLFGRKGRQWLSSQPLAAGKLGSSNGCGSWTGSGTTLRRLTICWRKPSSITAHCKSC